MSASGLAIRSVSRPQNSRNRSVASMQYNPADLILPDGQLSEGAVELLQELVHPHQHALEETLVEASPDDLFKKLAEERGKLPWYKRPSPWWFLVAVSTSAFAMAATIAPRIEVYTQLVCETHKPEYTVGRGMRNYISPSPFGDNAELAGGSNDRRCAADPDVQAAVATLSMVSTTSMGILGCLTTAWWTSLSDRVGRVRVINIALLGLLIGDFDFILVAKFSRYLPGGYWWFVLAGVVEGLLGSTTTMHAAIQAYIADTVEPHGRARFFSLFLGLLFCGLALGPTVGGLVVRYTGTPISVFYLSAVAHIFYGFMLWFVIPESLTAAQLKESRRQHDESVAKLKQEYADAPFLARLKRFFSFLSPLVILLPTTVAHPNPLKSKRRDPSLIIMALSSAFALLLMGSYSYKFQYTAAVFGWTSEQMGYWLGIVGFSRALYLTLIFPLIIKLFKPKQPAIRLPTSPSEPLQPETESESDPIPIPKSSPPSLGNALAFDLRLSRISVFIEIVAFAGMPLAKSPLVFTALSILSCFGAAHSPTAQSVALGLYAQQGGTESGKLLGAFSVLQTLSSQILGPAIFGMTYVKTVRTMPTAIFYLSTTAVTISFILLLCVRLPEPSRGVGEPAPTNAGTTTHPRDETLADV